MTEISGRRAGCGESRTSGSGEGARKHGRHADAVRHAPIPHIISSSLIQFAYIRFFFDDSTEQFGTSDHRF
jgi:hypothetical protein